MRPCFVCLLLCALEWSCCTRTPWAQWEMSVQCPHTSRLFTGKDDKNLTPLQSPSSCPQSKQGPEQASLGQSPLEILVTWTKHSDWPNRLSKGSVDTLILSVCLYCVLGNFLQIGHYPNSVTQSNGQLHISTEELTKSVWEKVLISHKGNAQKMCE